MLQRHDKYHDCEKLHKCAKAWEKLGIPLHNTLAPEVEIWSSKISQKLNEELKSKFVAANLLGTEGFSDKKI